MTEDRQEIAVASPGTLGARRLVRADVDSAGEGQHVRGVGAGEVRLCQICVGPNPRDDVADREFRGGSPSVAALGVSRNKTSE